jgi:hypothetical protein
MPRFRQGPSTGEDYAFARPSRVRAKLYTRGTRRRLATARDTPPRGDPVSAFEVEGAWVAVRSVAVCEVAREGVGEGSPVQAVDVLEDELAERLSRSVTLLGFNGAAVAPAIAQVEDVLELLACDGPTRKMRPGEGSESIPPPPSRSQICSHVRAMTREPTGGIETAPRPTSSAPE